MTSAVCRAQCDIPCLGATQYRGGSGPLRVSRGSSSNTLHQVFLAAGAEAGYPFTDDF